MSDRSPSFALRELQAHLSAPFVLAAQAGIALVLGLSGPFGTFETLSALPRLAYWTGIVFGTYALGSALTLTVLDRLDAQSRWRLPLRVARGGVIVGLMVVAFLWLWNLPFFGSQGGLGRAGGAGILGAFIVSWTVLGLRALYPEPDVSRSAHEPVLMRRLPLNKRGPLIALSATDHYVEVITDKGSALVLMRLADAITEAAPTCGVQVHRSHWIALARVRKVERRGDGALLDMGAGLEIPVSRRHMPTLRSAGLLPQKQG